MSDRIKKVTKMKKLLLILICLFVSFDVRSKESLTRLKLLCDYENYSEGFDFLDTETTKDWVNIIFLNKRLVISVFT